jgi:CheY-like chemotaxis protein
VADPDAPTLPPPADESPLEVTAPVAPPAAPPVLQGPELEERRARQRAAVRRSQLRRRGAQPAPTVFDVLVLEPDLDSRLQICRVLVAFGFKPQVAVTVAEAQGLSLARPHAAAILGLGDGQRGAAELCMQLRDAPRGRPAALIAVVDRNSHTDRVRMQLAGADQVLFRPAGRGDLARAFDACGLVLPQDPRHGAPPG